MTTGNASLIMVVDDDPDFLELYRRTLESGGYVVRTARDPGEAIERMAAEPPDVIVSDLMMSSLDSGFSFAKGLRQDARFRHIPIIIVTAASSQRGFDFTPRTPEELTAMCVDAYFTKPVRPETLLAKVAQLLEVATKERHP